MPMFEISKYFLPSACFLLIAVFFMLLPDLRSCRLNGGERRMEGTDVLIIAAIITPTTDAFTLTIVALPIWLLYELSILLVKA